MTLIARCDGGTYSVTNGITTLSGLSREEYLQLLADTADGEHTPEQAFRAAQARHRQRQAGGEGVAA